MDENAKTLQQLKICRFCLSTEEKDLSNIYQKTNVYLKSGKETKLVPLPVQIMSCVSIEVFCNDGLPQLICNRCRHQTNQSYIFKSNCKKTDDALKVFLQTGKLKKPELHSLSNSEQKPTKPDSQISPVKDIKILSNESTSSDQPRTKRVKLEDGTEIITLCITQSGGSQIVESQQETEQDDANQEEFEGQESETYQEADETSEHEYKGESSAQQIKQVETHIFPCPLCDRTFPLKQLLELHIASHDRERHYACVLCDKKFFSKYDLTKHQPIHLSVKPHQCVVCKKMFAREALLRRHEAVHCDVPKYVCSQCEKKFLDKDDLDNHVKKHDKRKPFTCKECNKSFVFKQGLDRHMIVHSQDKPHKCNYCEASFNSAIRLTRHITTHAGLRPYPCKICARTFLLSHHLTRHMRSHYAAGIGKQPEEAVGQHKCDVCSMSFRRKDSLINHSAIHSMVNLRCVICNTSFMTAKMVKEHITTHLQGLPFPCENCDYSFDTVEQLEEHELKHAEMEYEEQIEQEVISEVKKQMSTEDESEEENCDEEQEEVTEYHITDIENPELVPSQEPNRPQSNAELSQFFKTEVEEQEPPNPGQDEAYTVEDSIKPIFRSEGTKVYERKGPIQRKIPNLPAQSQTADTAPLEQINEPPNVEHLGISPETLNDLPAKKPVNVKVGDKIVKVQKFIISKKEMKQMAKLGILEVKNGQVIMKSPGQPILNATIKPVRQSDIDSLMSQKQRPQLKQYQRRQQESQSFSESSAENIVGDFNSPLS